MVRGPAWLLGLTEELVGDLVAWSLLLLGVVFGLGTLGAVELLTHLSGGQAKSAQATGGSGGSPEAGHVGRRDTGVPAVPTRQAVEQGRLGVGPGRYQPGVVQHLDPGHLVGLGQAAEIVQAWGRGRGFECSWPCHRLPLSRTAAMHGRCLNTHALLALAAVPPPSAAEAG